MEYVRMSVEDAQKIVGKDAIVLVSMADLEKADCNTGFEKKKFSDCNEMIRTAETIAKLYDDFSSQLRVFSVRQPDIFNIRPQGTMNVILFREENGK